MSSLYQRILVIRLGAFGDIVLSFGAMEAIRKHYPDAKITLMTTPPFKALMEKSGYFDHVMTIQRWKWWQASTWRGFAVDMRHRNFDCVYDLQDNDRTKIMSLLLPRALQKKWYRRKKPEEKNKYDTGALTMAKIAAAPLPDTTWLESNISIFNIQTPFVLIVPGCAPQHPQKRWPALGYVDVAKNLVAKNYTPVLIGTAAEAAILDEIKVQVPKAVNLCGKTSFVDIAGLARQAAGAVGNDTGPMHLIAVVGCPCLSLFSGVSHPAQSAPRGAVVKTLQSVPIETLAMQAVIETLMPILR